MKKKLLSLLLALCLMLSLLPVGALADPLPENSYLSLGENNLLIQNSSGYPSNVGFYFYPPVNGEYTFTITGNTYLYGWISPTGSSANKVASFNSGDCPRSFPCNLSGGVKYYLYLWAYVDDPTATLTITRTGAGSGFDQTEAQPFTMQLKPSAQLMESNGKLTLTEDGTTTPPAFDDDGEATLYSHHTYTLTVPPDTSVGDLFSYGMTGSATAGANCIFTAYANDRDVYVFCLRNIDETGGNVLPNGSTVLSVGTPTFDLEVAQGSESSFVKLALNTGGEDLEEVQLDNGKAMLSAVKTYYLVVAKGTPVQCSYQFGNCWKEDPAEFNPPSGFYDSATQDVYNLSYSPGPNAAPGRITVGGTPVTYDFTVTEAGARNLLSLISLNGEITLTNGKATLLANMPYRLYVSYGTAVEPLDQLLDGDSIFETDDYRLSFSTSSGSTPSMCYSFEFSSDFVSDDFGVTVVGGGINLNEFSFLIEEGWETGAVLALYEVALTDEDITLGKAVQIKDGEATLSAEKEYVLAVKKDTPVKFSDDFGYRDKVPSSAVLSEGLADAIPEGYDLTTADLYRFRYMPGSSPAPGVVTVGGEPVTYPFCVTARGTNGFRSLSPANMNEAVTLTDGQAVLSADTEYFLTVAPNTPVAPLDALYDSSISSVPQDYKVYKMQIEDGTTYFFSFSAAYIERYERYEGSEFGVTVGDCTVKFLDETGTQIGTDLNIYAGLSISSSIGGSLPDWIETLDTNRAAPAGTKFVGWKDQATGKLVAGSVMELTGAILITKDLTLIPAFQAPMAQVSFPNASAPTPYFSLVEAMQAVDQYVYSNGPDVAVPDIVIIADYESEYESCANPPSSGSGSFPPYIVITKESPYDPSESSGGSSAPVTATISGTHLSGPPSTTEISGPISGDPSGMIIPAMISLGDPFTAPMTIDLNGHDVTVYEIMTASSLTVKDSTQTPGTLTSSIRWIAEPDFFSPTLNLVNAALACESFRWTDSISGGSGGEGGEGGLLLAFSSRSASQNFDVYGLSCKGSVSLEMSRMGPSLTVQPASYVKLREAAILTSDRNVAQSLANTIYVNHRLKDGLSAYVGSASYGDSYSPAVLFMNADGYQVKQNVYLRSWVTVTWKNGDTTLKTEQIGLGETPAYTGDAPTKASTAAKDYTFDGWVVNGAGNPVTTFAPVIGDTTYTAHFAESARQYTITWQDDTGKTIDTTTAAYGTTPTHTDATKASTAEFTYTFAGWDPAPAAVTGDKTYKATFNPAKRSYTITWKDDTGKTIDTTTVEYGKVPTHPDPTKEDTEGYTYTFAGWDPVPAAVTGEKTYTATFTETPIPAPTAEVDSSRAGAYKPKKIEGLDDAAANVAAPGETVKLTVMLAEPADLVKAALEALAGAIAGQDIVFLEMNLTKLSKNGSIGLHEIGDLIAITIPYDTAGKDITVFRYHDGKAEAMKRNPEINTGEEGFFVMDDCIVIYARKFSVYAIGYVLTPVLSGQVSSDGRSLTYSVSNAPEGAKLIAARYDGGQMTWSAILDLSKTQTALGGSGETVKLFLLDGESSRPLCTVWSNREKA